MSGAPQLSASCEAEATVLARRVYMRRLHGMEQLS
jgi:hypothetical protein